MDPDLSIFGLGVARDVDLSLSLSHSLFVDLSIYRDGDWNLSIRNLFYI